MREVERLLDGLHEFYLGTAKDDKNPVPLFD